MKTSMSPEQQERLQTILMTANAERGLTPGDRAVNRQPIHTVYGGAHRFRASTSQRLGELALDALQTWAPDPGDFLTIVSMEDTERGYGEDVYARVVRKLETEPVEDFRIDFEDGFGPRSDTEEDAEAQRCAAELAQGHAAGQLPPFMGIRIKSLGEETRVRALRTLDIFLTEAVSRGAGAFPETFTITLPKVTGPEQVSVLADALDILEATLGLPHGHVGIEIMVEWPQIFFDAEGRMQLLRVVDAAGGRWRGAHFGTYDYTAALGIAASDQRMDHSACDHAKYLTQLALCQRGVCLSDGATTVMPIPIHRGHALSAEARHENQQGVHGAWRLAYDNIRRALHQGIYQGWDLHPAQIPIRYAACFSFFLEGLPDATARLSNFIASAAQASRVGDVFDDAATGQGLLNTFARAYTCGAITLAEIRAVGLTEDTLRTRSFLKIVQDHREP